MQCSAVQCSAVQCSAVQCSTVPMNSPPHGHEQLLMMFEDPVFLGFIGIKIVIKTNVQTSLVGGREGGGEKGGQEMVIKLEPIKITCINVSIL